MDALGRDLVKLADKADASYAVSLTSLDSIISQLESVHDAISERGASALSTSLTRLVLSTTSASTTALSAHKDHHSALSKLTKSLDKKFSSPLQPLLSHPAFTSDHAVKALHRVIAMHLVRQGRFETADVFMNETGTRVPPKDMKTAGELWKVLEGIERGNLRLALNWVWEHKEWLDKKGSTIEFDLHRSAFILQLLATGEGGADQAMPVETNGGPPPALSPMEVENRDKALRYAATHFPPHFPSRYTEALRLTSSTLFLPHARLLTSPYSDLYEGDWVHAKHLVPLFTKEFSVWNGWSKELPLVVGVEMGSGGALGKVAKVRSVMKERRTEWSQEDELPVEIPLPKEWRFHSVFSCPVSKEQAKDSNPAMMMPCGHVIARESLTKLAKGGG